MMSKHVKFRKHIEYIRHKIFLKKKEHAYCKISSQNEVFPRLSLKT